MPVTNNNEYQSFLKVENPSQILNYFSGGQSHQQQYLFGAAVAADHLFQQIMSNDKKRLCSEIDRSNANDSDSDVSVGQEKIDDNNSCKSLNNYDEKIKSSPSTVTKLKSAAVDSSSTSIKDDDDNSSNESSSPRFGFHANNSSSSPRITSIPQINQKLFVGGSPLFIGNPTGNFQEEILRNSQVYAGELMRHQLVAAAQLQSLSTGVQQTFPQTNFETSPLSDHHPFNFENDLQDKFPRLFSPKKVVDSNNTNNFLNCNNKSAISFQNIHSHLSAITQITNSFNTSNSTSNHHQHHHASMKKDDVTSLSSLSRESSQSPSGFQQQFNKHNNLHPHFSATHQNGLTDRQLKFSIDNILKADFGRRITEPLLRSSKSKKISNNNISKVEKQSKLNFTAKANANNNNESISPIESSINNAEKSPTSNEKNQSSSETSSNGTVWPAWVRIYRLIIKLGVIRYLHESQKKKNKQQITLIFNIFYDTVEKELEKKLKFKSFSFFLFVRWNSFVLMLGCLVPPRFLPVATQSNEFLSTVHFVCLFTRIE